MLNASGTVTWQRVAGIFGDTVSQPVGSTAANPLRFPGQQYDPNIALNYNYFRDYDPATGRYLETDPIGLRGGANLYAYANGDPVNLVDANGLTVYVGQHGAFYPWVPLKHAAIVLRPDRIQDFKNDPLFKGNAKQATLGGQMGGSGSSTLFGALEGKENYPGDDPCKLTDLTIVKPPPGMTDSQFIKALQASANRYDDKLGYVPFPQKFLNEGYNSNSYVSGLLKSVGAVPPDLPGTRPGYDKPIPIP